MNISELFTRYDREVADHILDVMHDTPVKDLIEEILRLTPAAEIDAWAKTIKEDL